MASKREPSFPAWVHSPDFQIPMTVALAVSLALGEWQCLRSFHPSGVGTNVAAVVAPSPVAPATAPPPPPAGPLDAGVADRLVRKLGETPHGSPAWVCAATGDTDAIARAEQIRTILTRAGWDVRPLVRTAHPNRPGYFLLAANEDPPPYVRGLASALDEVGIKTTYAVGYRQYYDEMSRTRPGFVGFRFEPDQTFLLVVGRAQ